MPNYRVVRARDVLGAVLAVRRLGRRRALEELEAAEPDLAEYALEELTLIRHRLADLGGRAADARRLGGRVEALALVLVTAVRVARLRLRRADDDDPTPQPPDAAAGVDGPENIS